MKSQLIAIVAAVLVVGCGESQQSAPQAEPVAEVPAQPLPPPVEAKPAAEAAKPEPPTGKAPDISIHQAAAKGNIEAVKQHIAAGTDVNAKDWSKMTPLHQAALYNRKEIAELLIAAGADVNAKGAGGSTPIDWAIQLDQPEIAELLRKHGAETGEELKAEGK